MLPFGINCGLFCSYDATEFAGLSPQLSSYSLCGAQLVVMRVVIEEWITCFNAPKEERKNLMRGMMKMMMMMAVLVMMMMVVVVIRFLLEVKKSERYLA